TGSNGFNSSNEDITGLDAGTYNVVITDINGCSVTQDFIVDQNVAVIVITPTVSNPGCAGGTGDIDISVTGGTAPYTYAWSNGANTEDQTGLAGGTYTVTVTDATGCSASLDITINQPAALVLSETHTNVLCNGGSTGTVTISATGGAAPYTGTGIF